MKGRARRTTRTAKTRRGRAKTAVPQAPAGDLGEAAALRSSRRQRLYQVTSHHLQLVAELDRLFPDLAPILDVASLRPGMESVETISVALLASLIRRPERPVFLAFSEINSERILDHIEQRLDAGAWSLDAHDIYAELLYRLFERLRRRDGRGDLVIPPEDDWRPFERGRAVFDVLAQGAARVIAEQVEWLTASTLPLPGIPSPRVVTPPKLMEQGRHWIAAESVLLGEPESQRLIAHALLTLPDVQRRLIYLREQRGLDTQEIARQLHVKPFEVLLQLRNAELALHDRIHEILLRLRGGPARAEKDVESETPPTGKLLRLRPPAQRGKRQKRNESNPKNVEISASSREAEEVDDEHRD